MRTTFKRMTDGKLFYAETMEHWTTIRSEDGESDNVKWYGAKEGKEAYVSATRGYSYLMEPRRANGALV